MLNKSFKSSKCKTSLKLVTARIKLMKNKKGTQMIQMKRELAQLLDSGQDRTARIRVEHLIREENMVAAYELIEIYCELIAARLPIIESQKSCPIDLKEAIASVIFASPRCSDIPELADVKKHFTAKYGKEFITAALELRPNCGVGRMVVEKLSSVAPDVQTKAKVLNAIAEEHNIKWDSKSFEEKESKPAEDLLNGPSTFVKAGEMHAVSKTQVPDVQSTSSYDKPLRQSSFTEPNFGSTLNTPKYSSADPSVINISTGMNPDLRSSGSWAERMENRQSFGRDDAYSDRKHWDIEFKDATSAAHAAAEAAERASMAARAAAELSSREDFNRRYSTESQKLNRYNSRQGYFAEGDGEELNRVVQEEDRRHSQSSSQSYIKASINDGEFVNSMQTPDRYSENVSFKETTRAKNDILSPKNDQFGGSSMGRQHSSSSSLSRSSTENEIYKAVDHSNSKSTAAEDPYVENYRESIPDDDVKKMDSYNDYFAAFNGYEPNDDNHKFDAGPKYDDGESTSYAPSPERTSATLSRTHVDTWNPRRGAFNSPEPLKEQLDFSAENLFSPRFSESPAKWMNPTESDKVPVTYYMDTPKFDSEDELDNSTYDETNDSRMYSPKQKVFSQYPEPAKVETQGSTGSLAFKKIHVHEDDVHATGSADVPEDDRLAIQYSIDDANKLSFGTSTGGFQNKGYLHPPYRKLSGDASSLLKEVAKLNSSRNSSRSKLISTAEKKSSSSVLTTRSDSDADADDSVDEVIQKTSSIRKAPQSQKVSMQSNFMPPVAAYFDDDEDSTEDVPVKTYLHPPYRKLSGDVSGDASSLPKEVAKLNSSRNSSHSKLISTAEKKSSSSVLTTHSDSDADADDSVDEVIQKTSSIRKAPHSQKVSMQSNFMPPVASYFDDDEDSTEDIPVKTFPNRDHLVTGASRRTKLSNERQTNSSNYIPQSAASVKPHSHVERKSNSSNYGTSTSTKLMYQNRMTSSPTGREKQPGATKQATSKAMPVSKTSTQEKNFKPSVVGQPSSPYIETEAKDSPENVKQPAVKVESPKKEDPPKRASHVHPKLPDYQSLAAHMQSLRSNRR